MSEWTARLTFTNLTRLQQISEEIELLDQVDRVSSLSLSLNIRSEDGSLVTEPFYDEPPQAAAALAELGERALSDPIYAGNLVSKDGRVGVVLVHLLDLSEQETLASGIDDRIQQIADSRWSGGDVWMSGGTRALARSSMRTSTKFWPTGWPSSPREPNRYPIGKRCLDFGLVM